MLFQKKVEYQGDQILVYFVDQNNKKQGTLKVYSAEKNLEIREEHLLYTQEFKDGEPVSEKRSLYFV